MMAACLAFFKVCIYKRCGMCIRRCGGVVLGCR